MYATSMTVYKNDRGCFCSTASIPSMERYLNKFSELFLVCRMKESKEVPQGYVNLPNQVTLIASENYLKIFNKTFLNELVDAISLTDVIFAHVPSIHSFVVAHYAKRLNKNYCAVVVGCAWDAFYNHSVSGRIIAPFLYYLMKKYVKKASYAIYVTDIFLQKRYPCDCKSISASNVNIESVNDFVLDQRLSKINQYNDKHIYSLATCAAVDVKFKAQEDVIKALAAFKKEGIQLTYYLAGGGDQSYLRKTAIKNNVLENVIFLGNLNGDDVIKLLDETDIYIQPSKQEGLPRAVIEAMNRACPVIGSNTAGIPELIDARYIFKRGSVNDLRKKMKLIFSDNLGLIAKRNHEKSGEYLSSVINKRRSAYIDEIIKIELK